MKPRSVPDLRRLDLSIPMADHTKKFQHLLLGIVLSVLLVWGGWKLLQLLWEVFSHVNPTVGAGMLAASATVVVSVFSVLIAKRLEYRATLAKEHREKKIPFYEEFVNFIFRIAFAEKLGLEALTEQEMIQQASRFTQYLIVWGADDVIDAWFRFRNKSVNSDGSGLAVMFEIENLLLAIRKDLGHENKGLVPGKILGLFVNDIHEHIKV
jgi:hypothetical protein